MIFMTDKNTDRALDLTALPDKEPVIAREHHAGLDSPKMAAHLKPRAVPVCFQAFVNSDTCFLNAADQAQAQPIYGRNNLLVGPLVTIGVTISESMCESECVCTDPCTMSCGKVARYARAPSFRGEELTDAIPAAPPLR